MSIKKNRRLHKALEAAKKLNTDFSNLEKKHANEMEAYKNAQELVIEELEKKHVAYTKALGKKLSAKEKA